ncbi:acetyltransferase [Paenibacillus doosanensis]|uniref:acetyltransferase n=1 Tax=Paenibacillus doosanensis TaxID=1229154 RepID=UPI00217FCDC7|nr:acetyltransferase [Paenibacillus doosanensis]MCS7461033.1 acetyltransferase [Paenibacillus doosanensis]
MELAVIGEGGHSKVILDLIRAEESYSLTAILDDKYDSLMLRDGVYVGPVASAFRLLKHMAGLKFVVAIGNNEVRKSIVSRLGLSNEHYVSLVHKTAVISKSASIGQGTVIMANTIVNADAHVGNHSIINTGAIIEHDNRIGDFVHVAPKATLTGAVIAREGTMIGAGATIIPGKNIGDWAVIGAGATVISDIPSHCTAVGTPAKVLTKPLFAEGRLNLI